MRLVTPRNGTDRRRRRRAPRARRPLLLAGAAALCLLGAGAGVFAWRAGFVHDLGVRLHAAVLDASVRAGFTVRKVEVLGRVETPASAVLGALDVAHGAPLLAFDPRPARERLEKLPWVREAAVERRLSGEIRVRLSERRPLALWQREGKLALVDETGAVILREGLGRFSSLPIVVGEDAPRHAAALLALLDSAPAVKSRLAAAVRVGGRRWNLRLRSGADIRLPEEGADGALRRLVELERTHRLLERGVVAVDLRLPDRVVIQLPPAVGKAGQPGADT